MLLRVILERLLHGRSSHVRVSHSVHTVCTGSWAFRLLCCTGIETVAIQSGWLECRLFLVCGCLSLCPGSPC